MIRKQELANGITLLTESMPHVRSVSIGVWLRRGSRHEPARSNGISHFIEHLVFKGTESRSAREIALEMDSVGGQMDAFTSKEYTCFYAKVLDDHLPRAVELLADIVQHPLFDPVEVERERQVVLEEIRMVDDTPDDLIYDLFAENFFPRHPLGRPIQGTEQTVGALGRRRLLSFFRDAYRPQNMLIVAAGNLKHGQMSRWAHKHFGKLKRGRMVNGRRTSPRARCGRVLCNKRELGQLHLLLGLPVAPVRPERRYPLFVLNTLLGGTMSSRLFQRVREERGLAYSVFSGVNTFVDAGYLNIYAATSPKTGVELVEVVKYELIDLRDNGPTEEELEMAKEHLKGSLMLSLESTASRMSNLARQEIYHGRQLELEETLAGVDSVTSRQAHQVAKKLFGGRDLSLAAVGRIAAAKLDRLELKL